MRRALPLLLVLLAFAPPAGAHAVPADLAISPFPGTIPAADEPASAANVTFQWRCAGFSDNESASTPQVLALSFERVPAWLDATLEPARVELPACVGVGEAQVARVVARVRNGSVPALEDTLAIRASWETPEFSVNLTAETKVAGRYVAAYAVNASVRELTERPQAVAVFPIEIENLGNGITKFAFTVVDKTPGLQVPVPNPVTLQAAGGQSKAAIPFTVQTPYHNGRLDQTETVTIRIEPHAALDPRQKGEPTELTFTVHTKGWYVPAPAPIALLGLCVLVALALRRRG